MSCRWVTKREKNEEEKTTKYGPLRRELKQKYQGYEVKHYNIIMDVLGGWCRDCCKGSKSKGAHHNMQKAVPSGTLNISRTKSHEVATGTMKIAFEIINSLPSTSFGLLKL